MKYRKEIDGLRAVAVIPVVLFHAGLTWFSGGFVGVDIFFVISGFLITTLIIQDEERGTFSIVDFYERRARRIIPALMFVVLCTFLPAWYWLMPYELESYSKSLVAVPVFLSNLLFWLESGYFDTESENKPLLHTWSLAVEEQYYVIFPLLIMLFWRHGRGAITILLGVIFLISLTFSEWGWRYAPDANYYLIPFRAWEIMVGAFAAIMSLRKPLWTRVSIPLKELLAGVGICLVVLSIFCFDHTTPFPSLFALIPTVGTAMILLFATAERGVGKLLSLRLLVFVGLISYSLYLWHQPILAFMHLRLIREVGLLDILLAVIASFLAAYITYRFVETPFRLRQRFSRNKIFQLSGTASLLVIALGLTGYLAQGFPSRLPVEGWGEKRHFTPAPCRDRADSPYPRKCVLGSRDAESPTFALWGDSFASSLYQALDEKGRRDGTKGWQFIKHSCPSIIGVERNEPLRLGIDFDSSCKTQNENALQLIASEPAIKTVILTSAYNYYLREQDSGELILVVRNNDGSLPSYAENKARLKKALINTIEALVKVGKEVILVLPHQTDRGRIQIGVKRALFERKIDPQAFEFEAPKIKMEIDATDFRLPNNWEQVTLIDPNKLFCQEDGNCSFLYENAVQLFDGSHFSLQGSRRLVELIDLSPRSIPIPQRENLN